MPRLKKPRHVRVKLAKGIRQVSPVASAEGMSIFVLDLCNALIDFNNKDGPTVYQKRSHVLRRNALYTW